MKGKITDFIYRDSMLWNEESKYLIQNYLGKNRGACENQEVHPSSNMYVNDSKDKTWELIQEVHTESIW